MKRLLFAITTLVSLITSCKEDDKELVATETIYEIVQSRTDLDSLAKYLELYPELTNVLKADGSNTLFAPDNNAFIALLKSISRNDLSSISPSLLAEVLSYHIVMGTTILSADLPGSWSTFNGQTVEINTEGKIVAGNTIEAVTISENILATNGVVHIISSVLIPERVDPFYDPPKLSDPIFKSASFTILAEGVLKADEFAFSASLITIESILSGTDIYTIFAPANASFEAENITLETFTGQEWYDIIMNHIVSGIVGISDMTTCAAFTTANSGSMVVFNDTTLVPPINGLGIYFDSNGDIFCDLSDGGISLEVGLDAELVVADVYRAWNGSFHVIVGILIP